MDTRASKNLAAHAAAGNPAALEELFSRCLPRLRRLLAQKGGQALQHAELDDLVQEAYFEATKQFANYTYQGPDSFFRWLATVALHRLANLRRTAGAQMRDRRRERPIAYESGSRLVELQPVAVGPGPKTLTISGEAELQLESALAQLQPAESEVITLARIQGLPLQEIADRMDRTRNAVALLLSRSLRKLKSILHANDEASS